MRFTKTSASERGLPKRLVLGFAALASAAVVGVAGFAAAAPADKPSKAECSAAGFSNYGQCVKEWAHNKNKPGNGYGGNVSNQVNTDVDVGVDVSGDDNFVSVAVNTVTNIFN